jgi:FtsH-binding integral membrane protein
MECMIASGLPSCKIPPIPDGCGIVPMAENRIAPHPEPVDIPPEDFAPSAAADSQPVLDDALEETYRRVLARALALAACALLLAAITAASLIDNSSLHQGFLASQLVFRIVFGLQLLVVGFCSRYVQKLAVAPAAVLLFAYACFCALEFSVLLSPATLAAAFLCAALMYGVTALWGLIRHNDLALPITPIFMILAGGVILIAVNSLFRTPSAAWTLSSLAIVIFAALAGYLGQQIRDFYQEYDDDDAEGWKASVLGALLLLVNSINCYLLVTTFLAREDDGDSTDLPR